MNNDTPRGCLFVFMDKTVYMYINILMPIVLFVIGLLLKSPLDRKRPTTDMLDTMSKDFQSLKLLYDANRDELKNRLEQIKILSEDLAQIRARCQSYENFLQTRTFETDKILKQVPAVLLSVAQHLGIHIDETGLNASESAHSQVKS